ncbi:hypothetical protein LF65_03718 [Clostridium beijerinckii]|uniref:Uncharacterized protein n=1 Tax=Clostridium beijerinckii TaxID=1520 RepID=A0A0B5QQL1_CLOBE|nr:hypothetical protein [Clostridium beijerinckii]AJH00273.1 hypothetical protein LF65_03718 [Clostridium beijerinckii]MBE6087324.1 hypothetical protein [Clostridium beijerinckii]OCA97726.1 hypothetical protein BGS1_25380 [Clostridium beijerinckii]
MNVKMNTKLRLIMEVITVLYLFLSILLKNSDTNISILLTFIWIAIWCIIFLYSKRLYGITDELVISILSKINRLVVYFLIFAIGIFSVFLVTPYNSFIISKVTIGIYLIFILLIATVIRLLLFIYYDRKGIYK